MEIKIYSIPLDPLRVPLLFLLGVSRLRMEKYINMVKLQELGFLFTCQPTSASRCVK